MIEVWKKIPGLEDYEASNLGNIRAVKTYYFRKDLNKNVKKSKTGNLSGLKLSKKGYKRVNLNNKVYFVHRLIAITFLNNVEELPQVNHKNGIKTDNRLENLEWCSNQQNRDHAVKNGLQANRANTPKGKFVKISMDDLEVIVNMIKNGETQSKVASKFNVCQQTISKVYNEYKNTFTTRNI